MDQTTKLMEYFCLPNLHRKNVLPIVSVTTAASLIYTTYRILKTEQEKKQNFKKIPIPGSSYPYVGHMMSLGELPGRTIAKWHEELGPIINLKMGVQNWILVDDPVLAHKIFVTKGMETSYRPHNVYAHDHYSFGGKGISFSQPDGVWKVSRTAALSVLAPKHIESYTPSLERESRDLVSRFIESTEKNGSVNPLKHLELFSMNVIITAIFSKRFDSVEDADFKKLDAMVAHVIKNCGLENDLPNFLPIVSIYHYFFGGQAEQRDFIKNKRNPFFRQLIRDAAVAEGPNVIKSLVEDGFKLSNDETLAITADLVAAGTDTVSISLQWNIAVMCRRPDIQKKVISEIDEFIKCNGRLPSFKERNHLPYCISVMKESMRFRSTIPLGLAHTAYEDLIIDGYMIPKNSILISSMDSMHMRQDIYPNPKKFEPERFMNNLKTMQSAANGKLEERDHFNFGWGRRICPGIYLAETEIFLAFVQMFARCYIEPSTDGLPDIDSAVNLGLTAAPVSYKVKFVKRADSLI
ncbi:cytochrome P450 [Helicostylum pulchrum]|nr:cytochrome P450 [Helicostylum pulchrum]